MKRGLLLALIAAALAVTGCGGIHYGSAEPETVAPAAMPPEPTVEPGFDPEDPAIDTMPEDQAAIDDLLERAGHREDFKVPRRAVAGLADGPLVLAVVARPFYGEQNPEAFLNRAQLAVYGMYLADFEILNGGFAQMWENVPWAVSGDLAHSAKMVGSPEYADIYRDAQALWPGGKIPPREGRRMDLLDSLPGDALTELDDRYAQTQYQRRTALGLVLGRYIRAHMDQFVAG